MTQCTFHVIFVNFTDQQLLLISNVANMHNRQAMLYVMIYSPVSCCQWANNCGWTCFLGHWSPFTLPALILGGWSPEGGRRLYRHNSSQRRWAAWCPAQLQCLPQHPVPPPGPLAPVTLRRPWHGPRTPLWLVRVVLAYSSAARRSSVIVSPVPRLCISRSTKASPKFLIFDTQNSWSSIWLYANFTTSMTPLCVSRCSKFIACSEWINFSGLYCFCYKALSRGLWAQTQDAVAFNWLPTILGYC